MESLFAPWRMEWVQREKKNGSIDDCVFCKLPACDHKKKRIVAYSEHAYVVVNKSPYNPGHVLVIPRAHVARLFDLSATDVANLFELVKQTTSALEEALSPGGFNIGMNIGAAGGASIDDHVHVHVIPRWDRDTTFMPTAANTQLIEEALDDSYERVRDAFTKLDCTEQAEGSTRIVTEI